MRLKLYFDLENEHLPIQYRKCILSFIKLSLSQYDENYFKKFYNERDNIIKPFTFAVFFRHPEFKEDEVIAKDKKLELNISTSDYNAAVILYNSFNKQKNKKFGLNKNSWTLRNISMIPEKEVKSNEIMIKFMSPLVVRLREDNKDFYQSFSDEKFMDTLRINIREQLKIADISPELVNSFTIEPIEAKKVIVKFYEKKIETSAGIFKMTGDIDLLEYLYKTGIGSKHSCGFGMFEII